MFFKEDSSRIQEMYLVEFPFYCEVFADIHRGCCRASRRIFLALLLILNNNFKELLESLKIRSDKNNFAGCLKEADEIEE